MTDYWSKWKNHPSVSYAENPREEYRRAWRNQRLYPDTLTWREKRGFIEAWREKSEKRGFIEPALAPYAAAAKQSHIDRFAQVFHGTVTHSGQVTQRILRSAQRGQVYYIPDWLKSRLVEI